MFDLTGAKRVRREELESPASSPRSSPDPDLEQLVRSKFHSQFAFTTAEYDYTNGEEHNAPSEDEAELRLFAAPVNAPVKTQKIRLSSPGVATGEPGLLIKKPRSYYFADEPTSEEEAAFQAAAIDGNIVLQLSKEPWPGCALPWKVRKISPAGMKGEVLLGHPSSLVTVEEKVHKRTRKGKKTRIAFRKKLQASKEKQSEQARLAQEKEEAEREKRARRNREKKVKKKAREKAKKAADGAVQDTGDNSHDAQDDAMSD